MINIASLFLEEKSNIFALGLCDLRIRITQDKTCFIIFEYEKIQLTI